LPVSLGIGTASLTTDEVARARDFSVPDPEEYRTAARPADYLLHPTRMPSLMNDQGRPPDYFEIHDREWWIDARRPAVPEYLINLITAAALREALGPDHTLWLITKALPVTLDRRAGHHRQRRGTPHRAPTACARPTAGSS
jgi:hypothetical protein